MIFLHSVSIYNRTARRDGSGRFARGSTNGAGFAQGRRGGSSTTQKAGQGRASGRARRGGWMDPGEGSVDPMRRGILCQWRTRRRANKKGLTCLNPEMLAREFSSPPIGLTS